MKNAFFLLLVILSFSGCEYFKSQEQKAIELVQKTNTTAILANQTWLDLANQEAKEAPNTKFKWVATKAKEEGVYIVSFEDEKSWGRRWEVTLKEKIVKLINGNDYLTLKYGFSRFDSDNNFVVSNITIDTLEVEAAQIYQGFWESFLSSPKYKSEIVYRFQANVTNNTDKYISKASLTGSLKLIFKEKTIEGTSGTSGLKPAVSESNPWAPGETKSISIKTKNIEKIFLNYKPEYTVFEINLNAEDPIGFTYDKNILEADKSSDWRDFTQKLTSVSTVDKNETPNAKVNYAKRVGNENQK